MTDRKLPTAAVWLTVAVVAVLVVYPLSFGPACWLAIWHPSLATTVGCAYWPVTRLAWLCPGRTGLDPLHNYALWGQSDDSQEVSEGPEIAELVVSEIILSGRPGR